MDPAKGDDEQKRSASLARASEVFEEALEEYKKVQAAYSQQLAAWSEAHDAGNDELADYMHKVLEQNRFVLETKQRGVELAERNRNAVINHITWDLSQELTAAAHDLNASISRESVEVARAAKRAAWATFWVALFAMVASTTATIVAAFIT